VERRTGNRKRVARFVQVFPSTIVQKHFNHYGKLFAVGNAIFMSQMDGKFTPILFSQETIL
jgi:hypothetical protein